MNLNVWLLGPLISIMVGQQNNVWVGILFGCLWTVAFWMESICIEAFWVKRDGRLYRIHNVCILIMSGIVLGAIM